MQKKLKKRTKNTNYYLGNYDTFKVRKDTLNNTKARCRLDDFRRAAIRKKFSGLNLTYQKLIFKQIIQDIFYQLKKID